MAGMKIRESGGDIICKRKKKRRRKESTPIPEAFYLSNSEDTQVAPFLDLGSACADPLHLFKQKKRKRRKKSEQESQNGWQFDEPAPDESSSEIEKQSLLAWVEMSMKPKHDTKALISCEGVAGKGQPVDPGITGRLENDWVYTNRTRDQDPKGKGMSGNFPLGHKVMHKYEGDAFVTACIHNGRSLCGCDRAREILGKDNGLSNGISTSQCEYVIPLKAHSSKMAYRSSSRVEPDSKPSANGSCHNLKRKREVDKVLDYVLKRSIVVNSPSRAVKFKPQTIKTDVLAWEKIIPVTLTCEAQVIEDWILSQTGDLFGFDVEWRPNRIKGQKNKVALLQLCNENECLIVQMLFLDRQPESLRELLADPTRGLAGVGVLADGKRLLHDYGLECQGAIELTTLAVERLKRDELKCVGLKVLVWEVLGLALEKPKRVTLSNWAKVKLDPPQIIYACMDAWASFVLSKKLLVST